MDLSKVSFSELSTVTVPNLVGAHQSVTDSIIIANGLSVGNVARTLSATTPADHVISQMPEAGAKVSKGTAVNLVISMGTVRNVALNKPASTDSEEGSKGNTADKGNDGNTSTRWCANDGNRNHWWKVDLDALYDLVGSEVMWEFDGTTYGYVIQVSSDNVLWTTVVDKRSNTSTAQTQQDMFTARSVRYVRIMITQLSAGSWASFWEFKVFVSPTSGVEHGEVIPNEFRLNQNYPNPFNPTTTISYQLPVDSQVTLKVYDVLGREIETLVNERQHAGKYSLSLDGRNLSTGVYYYRLQTANEMTTRNMALLK